MSKFAFQKAKTFNPDDVRYKPVKTNSRGGKDIGFQLNGRDLVLQIPLTLTYGCNERIDESSGRHSYDLALQFQPDKYPAQRAWLESMKAFQEKLVNDCVTNSKEWFGKSKMTKEVVEALMYPVLKYPKVKNPDGTYGEEDYSRAPTLKVKVPFWEGDFNCELYDMNSQLLYKPKSDDNSGTPHDLITKGAHLKGLIKCNGFWMAGGKCGITWKLLQACVQPQFRLVGSGQCMIEEDSDDDDVLESLKQSSEKEKEKEDVPAYGEEEEEEEDNDSGPHFDNDDEEEEEDEEEVVEAPKPKVVKKKKKVVKKKKVKN